jgi:large subunit ribosomal protein L23
MPALHRTIIRPLVTEQSSAAYQERGEYTFEVAPTATKPAIRQAIESLFGVKVTGVWTSNQRNAGRRHDWKKAIVTLREGDSIDVFEG